MRSKVLFVLTLVLALLITVPTEAKRKRIQENGPTRQGHSYSTHTITWWCLDLNNLLHVDVPVVVGLGALVAPDPAPIPTTCDQTSFPVTVPNGSQFVAGAAGWYTNKTYPLKLREALAAEGYKFHSQSPEEDLRSKLDQIQVEIRTFPAGDPVTTFTFDPKHNFRLMQLRDYTGALPAPDPFVVPELDISLTSDQVARSPFLMFPGEVGPVGPGEYRAFVSWHLTADHNDGFDIQDGDFIFAGWNLMAFPRFIVTP